MDECHWLSLASWSLFLEKKLALANRGKIMGNLIVILVIALIVGLAIRKIVIEKKKGAKCVGCPYSVQNTSGGNGCSCNH